MARLGGFFYEETTMPTTDEVEATKEQIEQSSQNDMEAGFNEIRGIESPTETAPPETQETEKEVEKEAEQVEVQPAEPAKPDPAEERYQSILAKHQEFENRVIAENRKLYGRLGELNGALKQMQSNKPKVTAAALKRLGADYPELAEQLAEDLSEILGGAETPQGEAKPPQMTQAEMEARVSERLAQTRAHLQEEMQKDVLSVYHKDWEKTLQTDDFKKWWFALPEDKRAYYDSPKAAFAAEALTAYKATKEKVQKTATKTKERLEAAVVPKGAGSSKPPTLTDDDAFDSGFKAVRGR